MSRFGVFVVGPAGCGKVCSTGLFLPPASLLTCYSVSQPSAPRSSATLKTPSDHVRIYNKLSLKHIRVADASPGIYVNLDPAADQFDYEPDVDIKDLISLQDVMEEMQLGPNGGLMACFEYVALEWRNREGAVLTLTVDSSWTTSTGSMSNSARPPRTISPSSTAPVKSSYTPTSQSSRTSSSTCHRR